MSTQPLTPLERLRHIANNPDPRIVGGSLSREQARALLDIAEAAQRKQDILDCKLGPFEDAAFEEADDDLRQALLRVASLDAADSHE